MSSETDAYAESLSRLGSYFGGAEEFAKCRKPDCRRKVKLSVAYCCWRCGEADGERPFELEPYDPSLHPVHCHSEDCEQRNAERGEVGVHDL